jgi:hypothetical protein
MFKSQQNLIDWEGKKQINLENIKKQKSRQQNEKLKHGGRGL